MYQHLLNKYGVRLTLNEASEILKIPINTLYNKRNKKELPFKTYKDGLRVYADTLDIAKHLESQND